MFFVFSDQEQFNLSVVLESISDNNSVWVIAIQYNKTRSLKYNKQVLNWYICIAYKLLTLSN